MVKRIFSITTIVLFLAAFSPVSAQKSKSNSPSVVKTEVKFLDNIEVGYSEPIREQVTTKEEGKNATTEPQFAVSKKLTTSTASTIESASAIQFKYSILLDAEVEAIENISLFRKIEEWYGTRYVLGGTTKNGIDCSAFVQVIYTSIFSFTMPRTSKEQHKASRQIQKEELAEGDLIFFNTRGGVSHVGIYLQNNKFVHAATSGGVMISDLDEAYWAKRIISYGRPDKATDGAGLFTTKP